MRLLSDALLAKRVRERDFERESLSISRSSFSTHSSAALTSSLCLSLSLFLSFHLAISAPLLPPANMTCLLVVSCAHLSPSLFVTRLLPLQTRGRTSLPLTLVSWMRLSSRDPPASKHLHDVAPVARLLSLAHTSSLHSRRFLTHSFISRARHAASSGGFASWSRIPLRSPQSPESLAHISLAFLSPRHSCADVSLYVSLAHCSILHVAILSSRLSTGEPGILNLLPLYLRRTILPSRLLGCNCLSANLRVFRVCGLTTRSSILLTHTLTHPLAVSFVSLASNPVARPSIWRHPLSLTHSLPLS